MDKLEEKLLEIDQLVTRSTETDDFVEPQLEPAMWYVFDNPNSISQENMSRVNDLFRRVAAMDKSTPFGCQFYDRMEQSSFPFTQEVLRESIDTEPYYNCNDAALKSYVAVSLRNANVPEDVRDGLFQRIPDGHLFEYIDTLRAVGDSKPQTQVEIPDELKNTLVSATSRDRFEQTRGKALCALVYFGITDIVPTLSNRLQKFTQQTDELGYGILTEITTTATALEYLTGDKRYRQLVDFVRPEMQILKDTPYSPEFVQTLNRKLKEF